MDTAQQKKDEIYVHCPILYYSPHMDFFDDFQKYGTLLVHSNRNNFKWNF